ncbi:aldo/keto reductase [Myxococcus stipitatus]|uniref:aldo/keto reductase n=1 Tax=Myxococcus stipitatus TaxID=83455 RepID=UPI001F42A049|nr:aldo/keto reductase [Myxococcus stipitatus]MCE9670247.1 aldo/keto reductase [Myxococcus stipitatus]
MKYTQLGRTGLRVSRLALGCMSYGTPAWRPWVLDEEAVQPFFRRAVELGINFFDTADMYSLGVSEEVTGRALRRYARMEEVVLATKVYFPMGDGPNMRGLSRKHIVQACEASLKRLGVDAIDLYQIHRLDPQTPLEETLSALDHLVRQGKVRYLGASSTYAWEFARALGVADRHGWSRFVSMQDHYNLVYREEEREMLPLCEAEGIGVIPWSPLARGLLAGSRKSLGDRTATTRAKTDAYSSVLYDQPGDWDVVEATRRVADNRGVPPAQVALAWLLSRPVVTAPIIGATKMEHLEDAVRAVDLKLQPEELQQLEAPYQPHALRGM